MCTINLKFHILLYLYLYFYFILFNSIFILFYFILFCFILFYNFLFYFWVLKCFKNSRKKIWKMYFELKLWKKMTSFSLWTSPTVPHPGAPRSRSTPSPAAGPPWSSAAHRTPPRHRVPVATPRCYTGPLPCRVSAETPAHCSNPRTWCAGCRAATRHGWRPDKPSTVRSHTPAWRTLKESSNSSDPVYNPNYVIKTQHRRKMSPITPSLLIPEIINYKAQLPLEFFHHAVNVKSLSGLLSWNLSKNGKRCDAQNTMMENTRARFRLTDRVRKKWGLGGGNGERFIY